MRKGIILAIGAMALLAGCDTGNKSANIPATPKWKGVPYRIAVDTKPVKANPTGVTLPEINFTANPDALETRAVMVVRFDASELTKNKKAAEDAPVMNKMIMGAVDIRGAEGALSPDYLESASKGLSTFLGAY